MVVVAPATQSFDFSRTNQRAALAEQRRALEERMTSGNADTEQHQQHVHGLTTTRRFEGYMRADIAKTHFTHSR